MFVHALAVDLRLPDSHSLKDKRGVLRSILDGARRRYAVAAAEVEHQDKWQRAGIAAAAVAGTEAHVCDILDRVERFVWSFPEIEVLTVTRHWLDT